MGDTNYVPTQMTQDPKALQRYLANEFKKIQQSISGLQQQINSEQQQINSAQQQITANLASSENASNLTSGTLPYARVPNGVATFPGLSLSSFTTSTATGAPFLMIGGAASVTPVRSGRMLIIASGYVVGINATSAGLAFGMFYGTGTAPGVGAAQAGTQTGATVISQETVTTAGYYHPLPALPTVQSMTVGTTYWVELACRSLSQTAVNYSSGAIYYAIVEL